MQTTIGYSEAPAQDARVGCRPTELLHESDRTRVTRVFPPDRPAGVIRKELLGPGADERLRHETAILRRLSGLEGVAQLAAVGAYRRSIMLADVGGTCLAQRSTPRSATELTALALRLARAVAAMHRRGVTHRDINPTNIVESADAATLCLIDFGLATTIAETRPAHHTEIVGTLSYLAPEQTGRLGRPVDQRADLYAVGATLYELATGQPPFHAVDPLRLCHDHLARLPVPPATADPGVPAALSEIIMHLLEKEPDNRYQTAEGLVHDLAVLAERPTASVHVGEHDFPSRLAPPSRLVGRDHEVAALGSAFTASVSGRCRGVLVSGAPGVGKTSLLDELRPIVTANRGRFVMGTFDRYRQDSDGVRQAFRSLARLLLAEPEEELAELRERMLRALGPDAALATAVVPEFATLLNVSPVATAAQPLTNQARLLHGGIELLRSIASPDRPVALVFDNLQWAGPAPLAFLDLVLSHEDLDGVLLVGAHRDGEVGTAHPLAAMLRRWQRPTIRAQHLRLDNLAPDSLTAIMADMLRLDQRQAADLAGTIAPYTGGNPHDTVELLSALRQDGVLVPVDGRWRWDAAALRRALRRAHAGDLLTARATDMSPSTLSAVSTPSTLESMARLDGQVDRVVLPAATGLPAKDLEEVADAAGQYRPAPTADQAGIVPARRATVTTGGLDLHGIFAAARALSSETSVQGLRARVADDLGAMTGATGVHLLLHRDEDCWILPTPTGDVPVEEAGRRGLVPLSAVRYAERTREPLVVDDATRDDRFARDPYLADLDRCSLLVIPIINRGRLHALLLLENRFIRGAFSSERLDGVLLIAGQLAVSLDNAMLYASLERKVAERTRQLALANRRLELLSETDPLTDLANRRRLEETLGAEWDHALHSGAPISLAMIDIDDFKLYNDHYGHQAGDACLRRIAARLRQFARPNDLVARYGGEEFAIVMPDTDLATAIEVADRVRAAVTRLAEPHPLSADRIVTVSAGVAAMVPPRHGMVERLVAAADVELYRAKRAGRNRVMGSLGQLRLTVPGVAPDGSCADLDAAAPRKID